MLLIHVPTYCPLRGAGIHECTFSSDAAFCTHWVVNNLVHCLLSTLNLELVRAVEGVPFHPSMTPHIWPRKTGRCDRKKDTTKQLDSLYFNPQFQAKKSEFVN